MPSRDEMTHQNLQAPPCPRPASGHGWSLAPERSTREYEADVCQACGLVRMTSYRTGQVARYERTDSSFRQHGAAETRAQADWAVNGAQSGVNELPSVASPRRSWRCGSSTGPSSLQSASLPRDAARDCRGCRRATTGSAVTPPSSGMPGFLQAYQSVRPAAESRARARCGGVGGDRRRRALRAGTRRSYSGSRVAGASAAGVG